VLGFESIVLIVGSAGYRVNSEKKTLVLLWQGAAKPSSMERICNRTGCQQQPAESHRRLSFRWGPAKARTI
jgi:hypothetical protein